MTAVAFLITAAHLIQRSLTGRLMKVVVWSCGALLMVLVSVDPLLFEAAPTLPLSGVAGAGLGLACAAAAAWWDEAQPGPQPACRAEPDQAATTGGRGPREPSPLAARALYYVYERHLLRQVQKGPAPRHVGVILDGNRRYARRLGLKDLRTVYRLGAQKLDDVLDWCAELRIPAVTLWVCSTDNLGRASDQISGILAAVEAKLLALADDPQIQRQQVRVQAMGRLELLPETTVAAIRAAEAATERARRDHADDRGRLRWPRGDRGRRPWPARRRGRAGGSARRRRSRASRRPRSAAISTSRACPTRS